MKLSRALVAFTFTLAGATLAACLGDASDPGALDTAAGVTSEDDLTAAVLECTGPALLFKTEKTDAGAGLAGTLLEWADRTSFDCKDPPAAKDAGALAFTCTERPQSVHPGRYVVDVTRTTPGGYAATLRRGTNGAAVPLACTLTQPLDTGRSPDAGPVPTFAQVKPSLTGVCGRCHTGMFDTVAKVKARRALMLAKVSQGIMPRGNPTWRFTPEGRQLLDYLRNSPSLGAPLP